MAAGTAVVWFRQDLRLHDNSALIQAVADGFSILPVFILDDTNAGLWKHGGASRWWLHRSLQELNKILNGNLAFFHGDARVLVPQIARDIKAEAVYWNRCYEPWRIKRDGAIKDALKSENIEAKSFNASLLWEPWDALKSDGTPYKVFTPYYRKGCLGRTDPPAPQPAPRKINYAKTSVSSQSLDALPLMPDIKWYAQMEKNWQPGEFGAREKLNVFIQDGLKGYKEGRNRPDMEKISRLSPHLHFGEISPREAWHRVRAAGIAQGAETDMDCFCSELGWREFSHALLYHFPTLPTEPLQTKFKAMKWRDDPEGLKRWQQGQTGIPIIDAGMRQLWQTGWMHNRVRMIVASFLVKNLLIHWQEGEKWFWDCLVDADLANNSASWQWVAGCGADAAPYFRIFNPVTQGQKFDPNGSYVRNYVPELKDIPTKYIHTPWEIGVEGYPEPMADLSKTRQPALAAFAQIKT